MMLEDAERFVTLNGRVLERRRFELLFRGGAAGPVLAALEAYRNDDGGYGHALEPDGRGPGSQPVHVQFALGVLDELGAVAEHAPGICDYLATITFPDGGLPFVHPNIQDHPRAPWWQVTEGATGSVVPTADIAAILHRHGVTHPWLDAADEFCLRRVEQLTEPQAYETMSCVRFLDGVRAEDLAERLGRLARERGLVAFTGERLENQAHTPLDYAPTPDSLAARWFTDAELSAGLTELAGAQQEDGGWPISWPAWTPVTEFEWRPIATVQALRTLQAYKS